MTPEEILERLDEPRTSYQWDAMDAAVQQREALTPLLLERLESAATDPAPWLEDDVAGLLYTLALLAFFREERAHDPMVRLARGPREVVEPLLGDAITEVLPAWLWQTSGGRTDGLEQLLADRSVDGFCRAAGAQAMVTGALRGELDRDAVMDRLVAYLDDPTFAEAGDPAWEAVLSAVLDLYPQRYAAFLRTLAASDTVDPIAGAPRDVEEILGQDEAEFLDSERERVAKNFPAEVHGYLAHWYGFQAEYWADEAPAADPFADPLDPVAPSAPPNAGSKPKPASSDKKKRKRKQQKQSRKKNRKKK